MRDRLSAENQDLRARLAEAEETLRAIRNGDIDALVISNDQWLGERLFTLEGSDASYHALIESMSEGALVLTAEGLVYYANRRLGEMLKTPHQTLPGTAFKQWIKPIDHPWFDSLLRQDSTLPAHGIEIILVATDGSEMPCHLSVSVLPVGNDQVYFSLVATDLAEQKAHQDRILAAERLARSILDQAAEAIVVCDRTTQVVRANALARQLCGVNPLGQFLADALPLELQSGARFDLHEFIGDHDHHPFEAHLALQDKTLTLLIGIGPWLGSDGSILGSIVSLTDISARKSAEEQIFRLAFYDPLTGLPNRRLLEEWISHQTVQYIRSGRHGALAFIDLDNFKTLNDTRGHDVGDLLLKQVAARIKTSIRESDILARLGGDEFVLILAELDSDPREAAHQAETVCAKIHREAREPYVIDDYECRSTLSIGITLFGKHKTSLDELLKRADLAMYQSKASGRDTWSFFAPEMQQALESRARLEERLRLALQDGGLWLAYQPQIDRTRHLIGAEALLRWKDGVEGMVSPAVFIPLAEETGLILPLGDWVLDQACAQLAEWAKTPETAKLTLAVNVSAHQFQQPDFVARIRDVIARHSISPNLLKLELTETLLLKDVTEAAYKMEALKALGISFSLDDFGTGYSSLAYLKRLPLDQLKIDQSFVRDLLEDSSDAAIVDAILAMARSLGLQVIAEGVETTAQHALLLKQGCNAFQGYLFGRPGPSSQLDSALA
ncbi:putative bifunctional diguanylate cyclase/phosphodiesterase [Thiorhodovibrio frisius]|uniref:cyclic-guanylate-specific phosphodiesterase n=1 Tax=Thiorhodovibrio frisius TaxID=631362 RepID=H8Z3C1_9GAMM|nr:bifunctional diguanylate cyclase/phosphodiesterase [Thiorhodovibrio frisius]EIC21829.1 PAS domain S-box/diguanylate cyclase (GGDEF) domain-containing protein [Thiorhodovibrio frisius]WPL21797.1 Cyclic di-GMP phosphodiesterase Gmr [Thiorhodovibrio frisius]